MDIFNRIMAYIGCAIIGAILLEFCWYERRRKQHRVEDLNRLETDATISAKYHLLAREAQNYGFDVDKFERKFNQHR